jgi:hypothetical protein
MKRFLSLCVRDGYLEASKPRRAISEYQHVTSPPIPDLILGIVFADILLI